MMGPKPRINLEDNGKVQALSEEGYSQRVIAVCVGCSQRSVYDILKKKTKKLTGRRFQDERERQRGEKTEPWSEKACVTAIKLLQR